MPKRKLCWLCGITIGAIAVGVLALGVIVKHEPNFYRQSQIPEGEARKDLANTFMRNFGQMMLNMKQASWSCDLTEAQINSFFEEIFVRKGEAEGLRKLGISSPTVYLEGDQVRLAFRYGKGWFSSVVSYELKIWLVPKEHNVIGVQILSARAGALPISSQSILQQLAEWAKPNFQVMMYRHEGTPVAIIKLQQDQNPNHMLTMLRLETNLVSIRGRTLEHAVVLPVIKAAPLIVTP